MKAPGGPRNPPPVSITVDMRKSFDTRAFEVYKRFSASNLIVHPPGPSRHPYTMAIRLPHPIPYQGSKRSLAPHISKYIPRSINVFYEPFAGSAAMSIYAAYRGLARHFVIADSLPPIIELLGLIIDRPEFATRRYSDIWFGQQKAGPDYYNYIRDQYNNGRDPIDLLYLICRCVKNAVRFNSNGRFTQSVDKRRLGMHPKRMKLAIEGVSAFLHGRCDLRVGDWNATTSDARANDFVYMDPPYLGTTIGRDKRYHQQLQRDALIGGLQELISRNIRFALSYDGMTGEKEYGPPLPDELGLSRILLYAGPSSQSTLNGQRAETIESLYLAPTISNHEDTVVRRRTASQTELISGA